MDPSLIDLSWYHGIFFLPSMKHRDASSDTTISKEHRKWNDEGLSKTSIVPHQAQVTRLENKRPVST